MHTVRSRSLVLRAGGLLLVCILISLLVSSPVWADVGPEPIMPGGSNLKPEGSTPIEMQAEKVTINVRKATAADNAVINFDPRGYGYDYDPVWFSAVAEVEAEFTMQNPTGEKVNMTVWFPLASVLADERWESRGGEVVPSIKRFQVVVKGKAVDYSVSELPNPQGGNSPPLPWASFPVAFPAKEKIPIKVSYVLPAQRPEAKWKGLIMEFNYIFQTGAGWAGPIGKAVLVVNLPYPASPETIASMPAGGQIDGARVRWSWENFEPGPANDFSISLMQPRPWEDLKAARLAVKASSKDGQAWVRLCGAYYRLSYSGWHKNPGFGEVYPAFGLEACQEAARLLPRTTSSDGQAWLALCAVHYRLNMDKPSDLSAVVPACQEAARLLPDDAAPHYGLAIMYLSGLSQNPSQFELQPVQDELRLGQELEAVQPPSDAVFYFLPMFSMDASPSEYIIAKLNEIAPVPTATAEQATQTRQAKASSTSQPFPTRTPTRTTTLAPTKMPSSTPPSLPTQTANAAATPPPAGTGGRQGTILTGMAILVVLVILVYLVIRRMRR